MITGENAACPEGYERMKSNGLDGDFDHGDNHAYIWVCVKYGTFGSAEQGITDLAVIASGGGSTWVPPARMDCTTALGPTWHQITHTQGSNGDFNQGGGSKWIYLCYEKIPGAAPIEDVKMMGPDSNTQCDAGMSRIRTGLDSDGDFEQGQGDETIYICKKHACVGKAVQGQWVYQQTIAQPGVTQKWIWGTNKQHTESKTTDWSESVSATVSQGWELFGSEGSVSITSTFSRSESQSYSYSWSSSTTEEYDITWSKSAVGKAAWQFDFIATDSCQHKETAHVKEFALTDGQWSPPCCAPGYATDAPQYKTCHSKEVMVAGGEKLGCKVAATAKGKAGTWTETNLRSSFARFISSQSF